jgi:D-sedoheptulose 7-phosphate isomerase
MDASSPTQSPSITRTLAANIAAARDTFAGLDALADPLQRAADLIRDALLAGHKLLCCGNGGSAADCAHFTAEIAGRYKLERDGFPAIDLTANHSLTTALINDYPPTEVFARQVRAIGAAGDVLAAFTTSGNSENVRLALLAAREKGIATVAFLGRDGGRCRDLADASLIVPGDTTARIQEAHLLLYHTICEAIDPALRDAG